uniref:Uncharacterized protein n=1 Tax=Anguilla anguilla TaxID=7936 RepID=A0A0E9Q641_ANGAN
MLRALLLNGISPSLKTEDPTFFLDESSAIITLRYY